MKLSIRDPQSNSSEVQIENGDVLQLGDTDYAIWWPAKESRPHICRQEAHAWPMMRYLGNRGEPVNFDGFIITVIE